MEYAIVTAAFLCVIVAGAALWRALSQGLFVDHGARLGVASSRWGGHVDRRYARVLRRCEAMGRMGARARDARGSRRWRPPWRCRWFSCSFFCSCSRASCCTTAWSWPVRRPRAADFWRRVTAMRRLARSTCAAAWGDPALDVFHVHDSGCTWEVRCEGGGAADVARVTVRTEVRPLPLLTEGRRCSGW